MKIQGLEELKLSLDNMKKAGNHPGEQNPPQAPAPPSGPVNTGAPPWAADFQALANMIDFHKKVVRKVIGPRKYDAMEKELVLELNPPTDVELLQVVDQMSEQMQHMQAKMDEQAVQMRDMALAVETGVSELSRPTTNEPEAPEGVEDDVIGSVLDPDEMVAPKPPVDPNPPKPKPRPRKKK